MSEVILRSDGKPLCLKCCWGDHCDNSSHFYRTSCPYCKGTGIAETTDPMSADRE